MKNFPHNMTIRLNALWLALFNLYCAASAATSYAIGFVFDGLFYVVKLDVLPAQLFVVKPDSKSKKDALRMSLRGIDKLWLTENAEILYKGTEKDFYGDFQVTKYMNKGDYLEKWVSEYYGIEYKKDNKSFEEKADIETGKENIQVKGEGANLGTQDHIERAAKDKGLI